jgi:hypothetical protein
MIRAEERKQIGCCVFGISRRSLLTAVVVEGLIGGAGAVFGIAIASPGRDRQPHLQVRYDTALVFVK